MRRSLRIASSMPGYCTFTATGAPPCTARWTWPIDAAANGRSSIASNSVRPGAPSSATSISSMRWYAIGVELACSSASTCCAAGGIEPGM